MPTNLEIAKAVFSRCMEQGHKPGKVQFTKYLYLLDYCNCRFKGQKLTTIDWRFYHYGPWSEQAEECMQEIQNEFGILWRDDEWRALRAFDAPAPRLGLHIESLIDQVVSAFKNADLNLLLNFVYTQTEPMVNARRGDRLDFGVVPVVGTMPQFSSVSQDPASVKISEKVEARLTAYKQKLQALRAKADTRRLAREKESYQRALKLLAEDLNGSVSLAGASVTFSEQAASAMAEE